MRINGISLTISAHTRPAPELSEKDGWIDMSIGSPKHEIPSFIREIINDNFTEFKIILQRIQTQILA